MNVFDYLEKMEPYLTQSDWEGLVRRFEHTCGQLAGRDQALRIAQIDLTPYCATLRESLAEAVALAEGHPVKAIYFEYNPDSNWEGTFFLCLDYLPRSAGDDDWACDWEETVAGPDLPEFASIYDENGFAETDRAMGTSLFLVARTLASLGNALEGMDTDNLAVCAAFHEQDPVMRLREPLPWQR